MKVKQAGFTLIELVMVIVLIGVLAAVAIPKFVDLGGDARAAAAQGVAGALSSASAINYAARKAGNASGVVVDNCQDIGPLLQGGALPAGYSIGDADITPADTTKTDCALSGPDGASATFTAISVN
jgi:MSHA pilin protein MshA